MTHEFPIIEGASRIMKPLDRLARRMAKDVIAGRYANAREAARENVVEYAREGTNDPDRLNWQIGNFRKKIVKTLAEMGFDKNGNARYGFACERQFSVFPFFRCCEIAT